MKISASYWIFQGGLEAKKPIAKAVQEAKDLGFDAIGRASCNTGAGHIKAMVKRFNRQVVIVSDKDGPKALIADLDDRLDDEHGRVANFSGERNR